MQSYELMADAAYSTFNGADRAGTDPDELSGHLLVKINNNCRLEDQFKVVIKGPDNLSAVFEASALTQKAGLEKYTFALEAAPETIEFRGNAFSTKWQDLESLVAGGKIHASYPGLIDADDEFRADWDAEKEDDVPPAAAVRWTIQAHEPHGFKLSLQGLPASARTMRKDARLCADTTRGVELASWSVASPMGSGGLWNGPVPVLFAKDVALAQSCISSHPDRIKTGNCLQKIKNKNFFVSKQRTN